MATKILDEAYKKRNILKKNTLPLLSKKLKPVIPMLATLTDAPFDNKDWIFEVKYDGYRAVATVQNGKAELTSRNLKSFTGNYPSIAKELATINHTAILDGEIVAENNKGKSHFQLLQNFGNDKGKGEKNKTKLKYYVFDLLHLNGVDLYNVPLLERKKLLKLLLDKNKKHKHLQYSDHIEAKGIALFKKAEKKNLEGIIAKEGSGIYRPGKRSLTWLKIKITLQQEMVIVGITSPKGSRNYFGSLLLGYYEDGKLKYAGNCGTGFNSHTLETLYKKSIGYFTANSPLSEKISFPGEIQWLKPHLVCQVKFTEWTSAGNLRHPVYLGLRADKKYKDVIREKPAIHMKSK